MMAKSAAAKGAEFLDATAKETEEHKLFRLRRASELTVRPVEWLVRDHFEIDTLALMFGDPASAKSFTALDITCCIASGTDWHEHPVKQGPTIYIAGEGQNGFMRRVTAWSIRHGVSLDGLNLFVSNGPAALCNADIAEAVQTEVDELAKGAGSPALIVIDTLARNFGADENSTVDMTAFIATCDRLRREHRSTVLLVHHTGHHDKTRARGAMALKGALDTEYQIERDEDGTIRMTATKMKDGPEPEPLAFKLRTVELEGVTDSEGQPATSAVLDRVEYSPPEKKQKGARGRNQKIAMDVLRELHDKYRGNLEASGRDPDVARVEVSHWREACKDKGMDRRRFTEVKNTLSKKSIIAIEGIHVFLTGGDDS